MSSNATDPFLIQALKRMGRLGEPLTPDALCRAVAVVRCGTVIGWPEPGVEGLAGCLEPVLLDALGRCRPGGGE